MREPGAPFAGNSRYQIVKLLGHGGMGTVYEAIDHERRTRVAMKTLPTAFDAYRLMRFKREFRALQGLEHPNLVQLFDLVVDDGQWFFTMELTSGQSFVKYVRGIDDVLPATDPDPTDIDVDAGGAAGPARGGLFDEGRLRAALAQLVDGVAYLHRAGKVHRDLKPSNVLVMRSGRVVILDFGLIVEAAAERNPESGIAGTAAYMAPEQGQGIPVGPAADWYAIGVMLFEILTGTRPFRGGLHAVLQAKQAGHLPGAELLAGCPADLAELTRALLRPAPAERPSGEEIAARFGDGQAGTRLVAVKDSFVGRRHELAVLEEAFEATRGGEAVVLVVEGPSGVGKSALVDHFSPLAAWTMDDPLVLVARSHVHEAVPFQALDALMDETATFLARQPPDVADGMLPVEAALLATHFPALRVVAALSRIVYRPPAQGPQELRTRLFQALRELLVRIASRRPLVVVIEDAQWTDRDSRAAFAEALRAPGSPPLLVIVTLRTDDGDPEAAARARGWIDSLGGSARRLVLGPLARDDARALAQRLLEGVEGASAQEIADEAGGHPLFIGALARHAALTAPRAAGPIKLDDALAASVDALDGGARLLLELVAISSGPLGDRQAQRATGLELTALARGLTALKIAHLVRVLRVHDEEAFEPFHDRVRELVLLRLDPARRRKLHGDLARALAAVPRPDPDALFVHHRHAGNAAEAARHGAIAAAQANAGLAFDHAADLYRGVLLLAEDPEERRRLWARLGEALANAGRGLEAAEAFQAAVAGAPAAEGLELRRRAAEQLLRSGRIDAGLDAVRAVLSAVGLRYPATPRRALATLLVRRARLRLRGIRFRPRAPDALSAAELTRLDVCWSVAGVLATVDTIRGASFQSLHLLLSLAAGEPFRVARALALEAGYSATGGVAVARRTARLLARSEELAAASKEPWLHGWVRGLGGVVATLEGRWRPGVTLLKEGEEILLTRCGNSAWELSSFQFFILEALAYLGRMGELRERVPRCLRAAEERGDLYGAAAHRTALAIMASLAADDVAAARARVREAMAHWSRGGFQTEHFWELIAEAQTDLYEGDGARAQRRVAEAWPPLSSSLLLRVQLTRIEAVQLRARVALAAARGAREVEARGALIASARRDARRLRGERTWCEGLALLIDAGAHAALGAHDAARAGLARALPLLSAAELGLYAEAARWRLGELTGGTEGAAAVEAAARWMRAERIDRPERMVRMLAPGF
jgi:hypothetical protein